MQLTKPDLAVATSHPTRAHALTVLSERASTASEIGKEIGRTAKHVSYHLKTLEKLDLIELVERRPSYGGRVMVKVYRAKHRPYLDREAWRRASEEEQIGVTGTLLGLVSEDISEALVGGTINFPPSDESDLNPNHMSRIPVLLDRDGWNQLTDLLGETMEKILEITEQASNRASEHPDEQLISAKVEILQFRSPGTPARRP